MDNTKFSDSPAAPSNIGVVIAGNEQNKQVLSNSMFGNFWEKNKKIILIIVAVIVLALLAYFIYTRYYTKPKEHLTEPIAEVVNEQIDIEAIGKQLEGFDNGDHSESESDNGEETENGEESEYEEDQ